MADIDVERKGGMGWLWWILGLILLALLLWWFFAAGDEDEVAMEPAPVVTTEEPAAPAATSTAPLPAELQGYLSSCTEQLGTPQGDMGAQHQFTADCLRQLREGLNAIIVRDTVGGVGVQQQMDRFTQAVQQLEQSGAEATNHANLTREAAISAATLLQGMRDNYFQARPQVDGATREVQQAAESIQPTVPLLEQSEQVRTFFRDAGDALRIMWEQFGPPTA